MPQISWSFSFQSTPFVSLGVQFPRIKSNLEIFTPHILIWRNSRETRLLRCLSPSLPVSWNRVEKHLHVLALICCVYRGVSVRSSHVVCRLGSCLLDETALSWGFRTRQCLDFITGNFCSSKAAERRKKYKLTNMVLVRHHERGTKKNLDC